MQLTLREEILVVTDYESLVHGRSILTAIQKRRKSINDIRHLTTLELSKVLYSMVEFDNLLEAWIKPLKQNNCVRIADMNEWRATIPLDLFYRLTPAGWRRERDLANRIYESTVEKGTRKD